MNRDKIDGWIKQIAQGRSFIDVGGIGEDSCNERISTAFEAGASDLTIADQEPFSHRLWPVFRERMGVLRIRTYKSIDRIDIGDIRSMSKLGTYDIVHSTGILYHLPHPISGLYNLASMARQYLIVNTIVLPDSIENQYGRFKTEGSHTIFTPALSDQERLILRQHYLTKFGWDLNNQAPRFDDANPIMPYRTAEGLSCYPYWWLFTKHAFRSAVRLMGFEIRDEWLWEDHTLALLGERTAE